MLIYLLIVAVLLGFMLQAQQPPVDHRILPEQLKPYLLSPPAELPSILLRRDDGYALTADWFNDKWSFVYFSHQQCAPDCLAVFSVLENLAARIADRDVQILLVRIHDLEQSLLLPDSLAQSSTEAIADPVLLASLGKTFDFWFFEDATGQVHQHHSLYLVDPKGRVYARMNPPFTSLAVHRLFNEVRRFYAVSE
ncbi:hypothetical protein MPL1_03163 [Methylophaga lonarensis MPL]|uniref:Thioredoxin domain-containing protein n=1 Tax=Methylophaga lonarensis MPL TaxID=1286106 RepID=M7PIV2_9GAMM|nr:hypothetical protein [Methylophaga lonarensis]EMR13800.1 hypothetical protein MPL1_03163 [Methylophaga lonarensis MPL]